SDGYRLWVATDGDLHVRYGDGAGQREWDSPDPSFIDGALHKLQFTYDLSAGEWARFIDDLASGTENGHGSTPGSLSVLPLTVGASNTGAAPFDGDVFSGIVRDGIGGPDVASCIADDYAGPYGLIPDGSVWTDKATGRIWTTHGDVVLAPEVPENNKFVFDGVAGTYLSTPDVNLLDADTAHTSQALGSWASGGGLNNITRETGPLVPQYGLGYTNGLYTAGSSTYRGPGAGTSGVPGLSDTEYALTVDVASTSVGDQ
ncbi:unnamed protein product, partial [marine sediment metagenome]